MRPGGRFGRRWLLKGLVALPALHPGRRASGQDAGAAEAMARAAGVFLDSLDRALAARAAVPFLDAERLNWHYVPRRRQGVPLKDLAPASRAAAHDLLRAVLSPEGYAKVGDVMRLEAVLRQTELFGSFLRDPDAYSVTVFGTPGPNAPWGWRFEGHHLSLNFTLAPGRPIAATPAFLGANPAEVRSGPHRGLRALQQEQDLGLALARSVPPALQGRLVIVADTPGDVVTGPGREESQKVPAGLALADLGPSSRDLAERLVETCARTMRAEIADLELRRFHQAGVERLHVAWAGPLDPTRPHYYRLHGPTLLIEHDNTQGGATHVHSVWHTPGNAFGADVLRAHHRTAHRSLG